MYGLQRQRIRDLGQAGYGEDGAVTFPLLVSSSKTKYEHELEVNSRDKNERVVLRLEALHKALGVNRSRVLLAERVELETELFRKVEKHAR